MKVSSYIILFGVLLALSPFLIAIYMDLTL